MKSSNRHNVWNEQMYKHTKAVLVIVKTYINNDKVAHWAVVAVVAKKTKFKNKLIPEEAEQE